MVTGPMTIFGWGRDRLKMSMPTVRVVAVVAVVIAASLQLHAQRIPHASDGMKYHDRMYRNLIFDDYDGWSSQSWVLPWSDPDFYIRLGGARGCRAGRRVQHELLHYWRAVIPILAEQLTGEPYTRRVHAGCGNRARQYGWIIVEYVTPAEYHRETRREWGEGVLARASLGSTYCKIWIRSFPREDQLSQLWKNVIAHEIGHAFGLYHTGRPDLIMSASIGEERPNTLTIFLPIEEGTARLAYRAGRGARYCGDPDVCGSGYAPSVGPPSLDHLRPRIVVD